MAINSVASRDAASPELSPQAKTPLAHKNSQAQQDSPARAAERKPEYARTHSNSRSQMRFPAPAASDRNATDDEILGLTSAIPASNAAAPDTDVNPDEGADSPATAPAEPEELHLAFEANPELRAAWHDVNAFRELFATPEAARSATGLLADLDRMDALFFSRRPEDHAELARAVAALDPAAFASLAQAMSGLVKAPADAIAQVTESARAGLRPAPTGHNANSPEHIHAVTEPPATPTPAQVEFFHAANAAAVQGVIDSIESQVARLLPENISKSARSRVVGEIYRELDATLRSNRELAQQMREAFRSGSLDEAHQRAIVSLVTGRARQALPGVAKRVLHEWTSTLVSANEERRTRQRTAERRVDIAGSGGAANDGRRSMGPRDIDYARLSDADILNL